MRKIWPRAFCNAVHTMKKPLQIQRHKPDASNSDPHTLPPGSLSLLVNKVFESPNRHITTEVAAISRLHRVFMQTCSLTLTSYYLTKMVRHARKLMRSGHKERCPQGRLREGAQTVTEHRGKSSKTYLRRGCQILRLTY